MCYAVRAIDVERELRKQLVEGFHLNPDSDDANRPMYMAGQDVSGGLCSVVPPSYYTLLLQAVSCTLLTEPPPAISGRGVGGIAPH